MGKLKSMFRPKLDGTLMRKDIQVCGEGCPALQVIWYLPWVLLQHPVHSCARPHHPRCCAAPGADGALQVLQGKWRLARLRTARACSPRRRLPLSRHSDATQQPCKLLVCELAPRR